LKGPSSGGKSHVVERVLSFVPESAYYALTAMSERTLAYSEEPIKHRFLVIYEAAGISGDFATYLIRSLLSEGRVRYETVEQTSEGMKPRLIEREGPTGLIVTTTSVKLHPENETRLLSLTVTDTQEQTRAVMAALAEEADETAPDLATWHALQVWLEGAEHRVSIPYAKILADLIPPVAVRLRRDFGALLNLIRAHALLHQASRDRDDVGRIIATIEEDYAAVRELVADLVSDGIEVTVPKTVRETVEAVKRLREDSNGEPVTVTDLARALRLDRSAVSRRVRNAKDRGYLRDLEENLRKPSRLVLGDDLPDDVQILPSPGDVRASMQKRASSNARPSGAQEPHRNGQYSRDAYKACSRARVQEGIKYPPPPSGTEPGDIDNNQDDIIEEVRDLFASDALEEV
jgi:MarR family